MLMRTDPFRDFDRLAQQVLGTPARRPPCRSTPTATARSSSSSSTSRASSPTPSTSPSRRTSSPSTPSGAATSTEGAELLVGERPHGTFSRQLFLGDTLDTEAIQADYVDGVLTLRLPVAEKAKPRRVAINAGESAPTGHRRRGRGARWRLRLTRAGAAPPDRRRARRRSTRSARWRGCSVSSRPSAPAGRRAGRAAGSVRRRPAPLHPRRDRDGAAGGRDGRRRHDPAGHPPHPGPRGRGRPPPPRDRPPRGCSEPSTNHPSRRGIRMDRAGERQRFRVIREESDDRIVVRVLGELDMATALEWAWCTERRRWAADDRRSRRDDVHRLLRRTHW